MKISKIHHLTRRGRIKRNPIPKKIHITKNHVRVRIREPSRFVAGSFRTLDTGRPGHMKLIRGRLKSSGKRELQSVLFSAQDVLDGDINTMSTIENMGISFPKVQMIVRNRIYGPSVFIDFLRRHSKDKFKKNGLKETKLANGCAVKVATQRRIRFRTKSGRVTFFGRKLGRRKCRT